MTLNELTIIIYKLIFTIAVFLQNKKCRSFNQQLLSNHRLNKTVNNDCLHTHILTTTTRLSTMAAHTHTY